MLGCRQSGNQTDWFSSNSEIVKEINIAVRQCCGNNRPDSADMNGRIITDAWWQKTSVTPIVKYGAKQWAIGGCASLNHVTFVHPSGRHVKIIQTRLDMKEFKLKNPFQMYSIGESAAECRRFIIINTSGLAEVFIQRVIPTSAHNTKSVTQRLTLYTSWLLRTRAEWLRIDILYVSRIEGRPQPRFIKFKYTLTMWQTTS